MSLIYKYNDARKTVHKDSPMVSPGTGEENVFRNICFAMIKIDVLNESI